MAAEVEVDLPDGMYPNALDGASVEVKDGKLRCEGEPIILALPV